MNNINIIILALIGVGILAWVFATISQIRSDITRINVTLNNIAKQVGVPDTVTDELKSLLSVGKTIEAVKKYRIATGASLIEAKEYVDSLK